MTRLLQSSLSGKEHQREPLIVDQTLSEERDDECTTEPKESKCFGSRLRHDLRNSLNVVMGFADLLSNATAGPLNEKQRLYLQNIQAGTRQMLDLLSSKTDGADPDQSMRSLEPPDEATQS